MNGFKVIYNSNNYVVHWVDKRSDSTATSFLIYYKNEFKWVDSSACKPSLEIYG